MNDSGIPKDPLRGNDVVVRPRRAGDIPVLVDVLLAQQPTSRYPFRDPLPIPVEQFLHAEDADAAWVAQVDGRVVGHVCRQPPLTGFDDAAAMNDVCADTHGCDLSQLAWVSTLFVGLGGRRLGVGRRLLDTVVADIGADGRRPCLEVLEAHPAAIALYESSGWRTVLSLRPAWLREATDEDVSVKVMILPG
ncbi:MAG TPA: GNAT family N-acetyltransferase [Nocardioides sp.]|nr:GNAT family N-acetyltransferase [Nocardioides sp.]